jgi:hypothetical protein
MGPRSPFIGSSGGGSLLLLGAAFEISRLFKILHANWIGPIAAPLIKRD